MGYAACGNWARGVRTSRSASARGGPFPRICMVGVFYTGERGVLHGFGTLREGAGVFLLSENWRHCKDFQKTDHLAPASQGAVMEWRWCSVAVAQPEIFPFHYADIRDWQELILMGAMCEIHSKLLLLFGCFRSANHMLCSSAQPWCGLSLAWLFCLALEVP